MGMMDSPDHQDNFGPPQSDLDYEFSERENQTIKKASTWAIILAIVILIQAGLGAVQNLIQANICGAIIGFAVALVIGIAFYKAGTSLKAVVETEGCDTLHMMEAIDKLGTAFLVRIIVVCVSLGFVLISAVALMAMLPMF